MSLIIKGVDMPKSGEITITFASDENGKNTIALILDSNGNPIEHKGVVEVPTPHGRLIDADEIEKCVHEWYDVGEYVFADTIRNADTIIEAEVSE